MSIQINHNKCTGCNKCSKSCPGSLIKMDDNNKAYIKYPRDCWGCASCIKECKYHAIEFFLGADVGGQGGILTVNEEDGLLVWSLTKENKETKRIAVDPKESNAY